MLSPLIFDEIGRLDEEYTAEEYFYVRTLKHYLMESIVKYNNIKAKSDRESTISTMTVDDYFAYVKENKLMSQDEIRDLRNAVTVATKFAFGRSINKEPNGYIGIDFYGDLIYNLLLTLNNIKVDENLYLKNGEEKRMYVDKCDQLSFEDQLKDDHEINKLTVKVAKHQINKYKSSMDATSFMFSRFFKCMEITQKLARKNNKLIESMLENEYNQSSAKWDMNHVERRSLQKHRH